MKKLSVVLLLAFLVSIPAIADDYHEVIAGSDDGEILYGTDLSNPLPAHIYGYGGDDCLHSSEPFLYYLKNGKKVNDDFTPLVASKYLRLDSKKDKLIGGSGDDFLIGRSGKQIMKGGKGSDTFMADNLYKLRTSPEDAARPDTILDFSVEEDYLIFEGFAETELVRQQKEWFEKNGIPYTRWYGKTGYVSSLNWEKAVSDQLAFLGDRNYPEDFVKVTAENGYIFVNGHKVFKIGKRGDQEKAAAIVEKKRYFPETHTNGFNHLRVSHTIRQCEDGIGMDSSDWDENGFWKNRLKKLPRGYPYPNEPYSYGWLE